MSTFSEGDCPLCFPREGFRPCFGDDFRSFTGDVSTCPFPVWFFRSITTGDVLFLASKDAFRSMDNARCRIGIFLCVVDVFDGTALSVLLGLVPLKSLTAVGVLLLLLSTSLEK